MQTLLPINPVGPTGMDKLPEPLRPAAWSVGERLSALVIGTPERNFTRLAVGGAVIDARTPRSLRAGERLDLRVAATRPDVVLRIESSRPPATQVLGRAFARALPARASATDLVRLLRTLDNIAQAAPTRHAPAPSGPALQAQASAFITSLPASSSLAAGQSLQRAVLESALPPEAALARLADGPARLAPGSDPGSALRRLASWLRTAPVSESVPGSAPERLALSRPAAPAPSPPAYITAGTATPSTAPRPPPSVEVGSNLVNDPAQATVQLRALVDGALARVHTHQLQLAHQTLDAAVSPGTNQAATNQPFLFNVDLPVRQETGIDMWRFEFEGDRTGNDEAQESTRSAAVTLELRLDAGVEVRARIAVHGERVDVRLDANDDELMKSFERHSGELAQRFAAQGLEAGAIVVERVALRDSRPMFDGPLIEESV